MFVYIDDCQEEGLQLHCTTLIPNLVLSACSPGLFMSFTAVEKVLCIWRYVPMPNLLVYPTGLLVTMPEFDPRLNPIFSFSSPACVSWLCPYLHDTFPSWPTKDPPLPLCVPCSPPEHETVWQALLVYMYFIWHENSHRYWHWVLVALKLLLYYLIGSG